MRRPLWFTKHPVQSKYLMIVMMSMLLPTVILSGCLYFLIFSLVAEQLVLPEAIHTMLIPVFYKINLIMIFTIPVVFLIVFLGGLKVSHRFAGPIERIERDLDKVLAGESKGPIGLRKNDDLGGVITRINKILERGR